MPRDQIVDLRVAVAVIVQLSFAPVIQVEVLVGVGPAPAWAQRGDVILAHNLGQPVGEVDGFELAADEDRFQLVDQDHRRIPQKGEVADRHLELEPVIRSVAESLHDPAGFRANVAAVYVVAGVLSGIAGFLNVAQIGLVSQNDGMGMEFQAIIAALDFLDPGREHFWLADITRQKQQIVGRQALGEFEHRGFVGA